MWIFLFLLFIPIFSYGENKELFVEVPNEKLYCHVMGQGNPLIVIHGGPGLTQDYLLPQMSKLAENHLVIFYDQRACGRSTGNITRDDMQISTFVSDLEHIRKFFGLRQISLLGHSWGGFVAFQYAIAHPEKVNKLIISNSMPASSEEFLLFIDEYFKRIAPYQEEIKDLQESPQFLAGDSDAFEKYLRLSFRTYCFDPEKADLLNLAMPDKAGLRFLQVYNVVRQNVFIKPFNFHDALKKLQMPTLVIHGDFDPVPVSTAENLHKSIPNSKFILMKQCGHFPYVEKPQEYFDHLEEFL